MGRFFSFGVFHPLLWIWKMLFRHVFIHLYRGYRHVKNILVRFFTPAKNKVLFPLMKRGIVHVSILLTTIAVVLANVGVRASQAETMSQNLLFNSLLPPTDTEEIETISTPATKPVSYLNDLPSVQYAPPTDSTPSQTSLAIAEQTGAILKPTLSTVSAAGGARKQAEYYLVEGGDTIGTIAEKFGISVNTLLWENRLGETDFIKPGQKLTILPTSGVSHQIQKNDTVSSIAKKYSVTEDAILEYNQLADAGVIEVNQVLIIPGGKPPAPPAPVRTTQFASAPSNTGSVPASARVAEGARLQWPTPSHRMNQYFTYRHSGVDIDGDYSSPIWAAADGTVQSVSYQNYGYGYHVILNHGGGMTTIYAHASKIFVKPGQHVTKGQTLAMVGTTGRSTGTHLHFEVLINGRKVNPLSYL